tara:strand:- start:374 stop:505 length:132 start_codon:yes stop_codon:yes gene_type:complete
MGELLIKYQFQGYPYIVTDGKGEFFYFEKLCSSFEIPRTLNFL